MDELQQNVGAPARPVIKTSLGRFCGRGRGRGARAVGNGGLADAGQEHAGTLLKELGYDD